jgi:hypothetical protein
MKTTTTSADQILETCVYAIFLMRTFVTCSQRLKMFVLVWLENHEMSKCRRLRALGLLTILLISINIVNAIDPQPPCFRAPTTTGECNDDPHELVVELYEHNDELARRIADDHNLDYFGSVSTKHLCLMLFDSQLGGLKKHYVYGYHKSKHTTVRRKRDVSNIIDGDSRIKWHEPQVIINAIQ